MFETSETGNCDANSNIYNVSIVTGKNRFEKKNATYTNRTSLVLVEHCSKRRQTKSTHFASLVNPVPLANITRSSTEKDPTTLFCMQTLVILVVLSLLSIVNACSDLTPFMPACPGKHYCVATENNESLYSSCFDTDQRSPLFVVHKIVRDRWKEGKRCKGTWHVVSNTNDHESHAALVQEQGSGAAFANQAFQVWQ